MSSSGVSFSGLATGIDTDSIISKLSQIAAQPISRLQTQQSEIQTKQGVYKQFRSVLSSFAQAGGALNTTDAFNPVTSSSSDSSVAVLAGSSSAGTGTYNLEVAKLAKANKIATTAQSDTSSALGLTAGTIVVNGQSVLVDETDSLQSLAQKINTVSAGVTASLINGGTGNAYLTLTSAETGSAQRIQISDLEGNNAKTLGLTTDDESVRSEITNGAKSYTFDSNTETLGELLGTDVSGSKTFQINGTDVSIDYSTDTMQTMVDKINAAGAGATATLVSSTKDSKTVYEIQITGDSSTPTFTDSSGVLNSLGVLQKGYGNQLVAAQDAEYTLDGVALTSSTNVIKTAIPGATLTLMKATSTSSSGTTTTAASTLTLGRDYNAIKTKVTAFTDAYNNVVKFIDNYSSLDTSTYESGPLFGDATARQVESTLSRMLFTDVPGVTGDYKNLAGVGFSFNEDGTLTFDSTKLTEALQADVTGVAALFKSTGTTSSDTLTYVSSTSTTRASGTGSYDINITQAATKGTATAGIAQTDASVGETLTFNGSLFGSKAYTFTVDVGSSLSDTITKLNKDAKLKDLVVASEVDGKLTFTSKKYGTSGNFTVASNIAAATNNSGIGYGGATYVNGVDVAGTINGQASTGSGQFLTAKADTGSASGLQIQYTGTTTGSVGSINFRKGVAMQANDLIGTFTDSVSGILTASDKSFQNQIDDIQEKIDKLNTRLTEQQTELKTKYAAMEEAIASLNSQATALSSLYSSSSS